MEDSSASAFSVQKFAVQFMQEAVLYPICWVWIMHITPL